MSCLWITASCVLWSVVPYTVLDIWEFPVTLILMRWLTATTQFFEKCVPVSALWCTGLIPAFGATRSIHGHGMAFIPIHHSVENCTSNHWGKSYWKHHHSYDNLSVLDTSKLMKWTSFCSLYWGWGCGVGCGGCSEEGVGVGVHWGLGVGVAVTVLTHWGRDKMTAILQTAFQIHKNVCITFKNLFPSVQFEIGQHWFGWWLGAEQATGHCGDRWWPGLGTHILVTRPQWVNICVSFLR